MEYYYRKINGKVYRARIEYDEEPLNPREFEGNRCKLYMWWNGYDLGDKKPYNSPLEYILVALMEKYLPDVNCEDITVSKMIMALNSKASDKIKIMPIFVYEHSGITISTGNDYPYNDRWDGGLGGYAIIEREKEELYHDDEWAKAADIITAEVNEYDMYLTGSCYGYIEDTYIGGGKWEENTENCWGYLTDKYGDELVVAILGETITEEEAIKACEEYDRKENAKAEYGLYLMAM